MSGCDVLKAGWWRCALVILVILSALGSSDVRARARDGEARLDTILNIGVALGGNPADPHAHLAFRALMLDLIARGYVPTDLRPLFGQTSDSSEPASTDPDSLRDSLRRSGLPLGALALLSVSTDSAVFRFDANRPDMYRQANVPVIQLELEITANPGGEQLYDVDVSTEGKILGDRNRADHFYSEPIPVLVSRSLIDLLAEMPVHARSHRVEIRYRLPVVAYADQAFRTLHGKTWQKVLGARLDIAAGFFRSQLHLDLPFAGARPWEYSRFATVGNALQSLDARLFTARDTLFLGFLLDPNSVRLSESMDYVGVASFLNNVGVVKEIPSIGEEGYWYTLKHALVIVHEIGHMLGAVHVNDRGSFLYPTAGYFGFRFDSLNVTILNGTRRAFGRLDPPGRIRTFLPLILASVTWPPFRRELMVETLQEILSAQWMDSAGVIVRVAVLDTLSLDSALVYALAGFRAFSRGLLPEAQRNFQAAVEKDSTLVDGFSYLERIAVVRGDVDAAEKYRRLGRVAPR